MYMHVYWVLGIGYGEREREVDKQGKKGTLTCDMKRERDHPPSADLRPGESLHGRIGS